MMENKYSILGLAILALIPWKIFYTQYRLLQQQYEEQLLFRKRHNCVVTYTGNKGMSGWPPYKNRILFNIRDIASLDALYEPIIFFIKTAEKSIDIAYMIILVEKVFDALVEAHKRGVKIRLLLNCVHCKKPLIRRYIKEGIDIQLYISHKPNLESIMHYKYMLKDFNKEKGGYVLNGSMNLTRSAFLENYEHVVFSSDPYLAASIHDNFERCWNYVQLDNQSLINKTTLLYVLEI